jgi:hypothetical protein
METGRTESLGEKPPFDPITINTPIFLTILQKQGACFALQSTNVGFKSSLNNIPTTLGLISPQAAGCFPSEPSRIKRWLPREMRIKTHMTLDNHILNS